MLIAPIVTAAFFLDIYSSAGCQFVTLDVGFVPSNSAWMVENSASADLGLFFYQTNEVESNKYRAMFHDGCREFPMGFDAFFVSGDRTWKVARIMAYIAAVAGLVATVSYLVVCPRRRIWSLS